MLTVPEDLSEWTYNLILDIVRTHEGEPAEFDYKEVLHATDKLQVGAVNDSICRHVCALANSGGGYLIFGVRDRKQNVATPEDRVVGIPYEHLDLGKEFGNKLQRKIQRAVPFEASTNAIPIPNAQDRGLLVVKVIDSPLRPHMLTSTGTFYRRDGGGNAVPMDYHEVRDQMLHAVSRQRMLDNLRWELQENIARLCHKSKKGLVIAERIWISRPRSEIRLTPGRIGQPVELTREQARDVVSFWLTVSTLSKLKTAVLQTAVFSESFSPQRLETDGLAHNSQYTVLHSLLSSVESVKDIASSLTDTESMAHFEALSQAVRQKIETATILKHELTLLFGLHDRCVDVLRLSVTLLEYCMRPQSGLRMPPLAPLSPIDEMIPTLEGERVTPADVELWVSNGMLRHMLTGEGEYGQADFEAATQLVPAVGNLINEAIEQRAAEFKRGLANEGEEAAKAWLQLPGSKRLNRPKKVV